MDYSQKSNPKGFWSLICEVRSSNSDPMSLKFDDKLAEEPQAIADLFADFFSSIDNLSIDKDVATPTPVYKFWRLICLFILIIW